MKVLYVQYSRIRLRETNGVLFEVRIECIYVKVKVKQSRYRPGATHMVPGSKFPRLHGNGTGWC